jgi:hypothetical protein
VSMTLILYAKQVRNEKEFYAARSVRKKFFIMSF